MLLGVDKQAIHSAALQRRRPSAQRNPRTKEAAIRQLVNKMSSRLDTDHFLLPPKGSFPLGRVAVEASPAQLFAYSVHCVCRAFGGLQTCAVVATCERSRAAFSVGSVAARAQSQGWSPDCYSQLARNAPPSAVGCLSALPSTPPTLALVHR